MQKICLLFLLTVLLSCESDNEHFCSKYQFYFNRLTEPGVLPFSQLKPQLKKDLKKNSKAADDAKMALFVIQDIEIGLKKDSETARDYCMRRQRWQGYR